MKLTFKQHLLSELQYRFTGRESFTMAEVSSVAIPRLQKLYPNNNTVYYSIAHHLQNLRDEKVIKFVDRGVYSWA